MGANPFILAMEPRQATPRHSLIFSFWRGEPSSRMKAMSGEVLQAHGNPVP